MAIVGTDDYDLSSPSQKAATMYQRALRLIAPFAIAMLAACAVDDPSGPTASGAHPNFITGGVPTGTSFGNVGALLLDFDGSGTIEGFELVCTGGLIAPTVFLTAAHCLYFFPADAQFYVSFDPALLPGPPHVIAAESFDFHPDVFFDNGGAIAKNDLGVVILPAGSTSGIAPLQLPPLGFLDALQAAGELEGTLFLNVGYGLDASQQGHPAYAFDGVRKISKSRFKGLTSDWLDLLNNSNATAEGGSCFGDSGGPKFLDGNPTVVMAVTSWSDAVCRATEFNQRVDTPAARSFLGQYVQLP
jgi:V8-like Glu-specific endopeptidase